MHFLTAFSDANFYHPLPGPLPSRARELYGIIFMAWMDFMYVRRCPVAKARRDSAFVISNMCGFFILLFYRQESR